MSESGRVDLNVQRKTGTCQGSFICNNKNCTKVTTESVIDTIDFKQERGSGYSCNSCGYYAIYQPCGCKRAVELDMDIGLMTLWHEGTHTCKAKPNKALKTQYAKDNVLDVKLRATPKEMKIDLIEYYLATGQIEKA